MTSRDVPQPDRLDLAARLDRLAAEATAPVTIEHPAAHREGADHSGRAANHRLGLALAALILVVLVGLGGARLCGPATTRGRPGSPPSIPTAPTPTGRKPPASRRTTTGSAWTAWTGRRWPGRPGCPSCSDRRRHRGTYWPG